MGGYARRGLHSVKSFVASSTGQRDLLSSVKSSCTQRCSFRSFFLVTSPGLPGLSTADGSISD